MVDPTEAFTLDPATGRLFWRQPPKNHAEKVGSEAGYICNGVGKNKDYWQVRLGGKTFKRARVIFYMFNGRWPTPCVDHINGNSLDDRPDNLREATYVENARNMAPKSGKRSGLPLGVSPFRNRFRAQITINRKRRVIGAFDTPQEAHEAYQDARKEAFGDFA